jgi:hypothetical protein
MYNMYNMYKAYVSPGKQHYHSLFAFYRTRQSFTVLTTANQTILSELVKMSRPQPHNLTQDHNLILLSHLLRSPNYLFLYIFKLTDL